MLYHASAWGKSYVVSIGQKDGESVGITCDAEDRCRVKLLLYPDTPAKLVLTASVQVIGNEALIIFKANEKQLYASRYKDYATKRYVSLALDKDDRLHTKVYLYLDKPRPDDAIIANKSNAIATVFLSISTASNYNRNR